MKTVIKTTTMFALILFLSLGAVSQVSYDSDKSVDFSKYKTYSFLGWQKDSTKLIDDLDKQRIQDAFTNEFESRGMQYVKENGQMAIALYLVVDAKQSVTAYTDYTGGLGYGGMRPWGVGYYGGVGMGTATTTYNTYDYQEGTLILSCYDEASKHLLWQGTYKGVIQAKAQKREKTIPRHVKQLMRNYPIEPIKK